MADDPADERDVSYDDVMRVEDGVVRPPGSGFPPGQAVGEDLRSEPDADADADREGGDAARPGDA